MSKPSEQEIGYEVKTSEDLRYISPTIPMICRTTRLKRKKPETINFIA